MFKCKLRDLFRGLRKIPLLPIQWYHQMASEAGSRLCLQMPDPILNTIIFIVFHRLKANM